MANSQQVAIRAYVAELLAASPAVAAVIFENREFTLAEGVASQVHVNVSDSHPIVDELLTAAPIDWDTTVELRAKTRKGGNVEAPDAADAIWAAAYARVMADQTLGGLVQLMTPGDMAVDGDEADTSVTQLTWSFTVRHRTSNNVLT